MTQAAQPTASQPYLTLEDYLAYDDGGDRRYELENGTLVEIWGSWSSRARRRSSGGTVQRSIISN